MRILEDIACGMLGYTLGSRRRINNDDVKNIIDSYLTNVKNDDLINDYAKFHPEYQGGSVNTAQKEEPYGYGGSYMF